MILWLNFVILVGATHSCWVEAATKSSLSSSEKSLLKNQVLDLSHLPHLQAKTLANAIQSHVVAAVVQKDHDQNEISMIDLSSSSIGDDGIQQILDAVFVNSRHNNDVHATAISSFRARMNNFSPLGATAILQAILSNQKNATTTNTTEIDASSNNTNNAAVMEPEQPASEEPISSTTRRRVFTSLDLSWNPLSPDGKGSKAFHRALQTLFSDGQACPIKLSFDCCGLGPAACRAMGKGIVNCYTATATAIANHNANAKPTTAEDETSTSNNGNDSDNTNKKKINKSRTSATRPSPLSLSLCGNPSIGDAGAAALAAAIRTAATLLPDNNNNAPQQEKDDSANDDCDETPVPIVVFEELNLSCCDIGDAGAEALALALDDAPGCCIKHLDLSNNRISNKGAMAIGRALTVVQSRNRNQGGRIVDPKIVSLDLSNNKDITDRGVSALATALGTGNLQSLSLRSCHVYADGAALFGKALRSLMSAVSNNDEKDTNEDDIIMVALDLSGNPLGILRGKKGRSDSKMGNGGGMYSASRIKSKATATAASYMNLLRKGLNVDALLGGTSSTLESDDEADDDDSKDKDAMSSKEDNDDPTKSPCGAKALADAFLGEVNESDDEKNKIADKGKMRKQATCFRLGLRHCSLDHDAADALAALVVDAKDKYGINDFSLDVSMNNVLEDEMVAALQNDGKKYDSLLHEMAEKHVDIRQALWESQQRATEARAAAARARELESARQREAKRDVFFAFGEDDAVHDSDADDENDGEEDYY